MTLAPRPSLSNAARTASVLRRSGATSDALSDLLRTVRLTGAVFFDFEASAPWTETQPPGTTIANSVLPGVQHLIPYHAVVAGRCCGGLLDGERIRLEAGDVIVFPHGDAHVMSSDPGVPGRLEPDRHRQRGFARPATVRADGHAGERTHLVCGFLGCDVLPFNPLISGLPRVLHVRCHSGPNGGWLGHLVQVAMAESLGRRSGGESVLARVSELLFVEAVRRHLESLPADQTGWLAGWRDPQIGRALELLHERPAWPWTLQALARAVTLSRSVLAARFTQLVGQPAMQYLANWRMQIATGALARGDKIASVALEVGYDSEAAFSRAFKKLLGRSPSAWRAGSSPAPAEARSVAARPPAPLGRGKG